MSALCADLFLLSLLWSPYIVRSTSVMATGSKHPLEGEEVEEELQLYASEFNHEFRPRPLQIQSGCHNLVIMPITC